MVGGGVLWFGKNRPLYGLLCAFFSMEISEEKYFEEKIPLKTYDKTKENAIFFRKFLKGHCEIYNAVFPPPIARGFFNKHGFVACCRLRQSAVALQHVSAHFEIFKVND